MTSKAFDNATDANRQQGGRRNLIINGAMQVAQRGTSATAQQAGSFQYYTADRFLTYFYGAGVATQEQVSDAPTDFNFSTKFTVTTPDSSIGAADDYIFGQRLEGFNSAPLNLGTANAQTFTLSFWLKCSSTGTLAVAFQNSAANRSYVSTVTIDSADTWEYKTITLTGDTTGTWIGATNGVGLSVYFSLGNTKQVTANTWSAGNYLGVSGATNFMATDDLTFQITGVQLEVGTVATPFEHRSYGEELALCQRYFIKLGDGSAIYLRFGVGYNWSINVNNPVIHLPTKLRAAPTLTTTGSFGIYNASAVVSAVSSVEFESSGSSQTQISVNATTSGLTRGDVGTLIANNDATTTIQLDAEL